MLFHLLVIGIIPGYNTYSVVGKTNKPCIIDIMSGNCIPNNNCDYVPYGFKCLKDNQTKTCELRCSLGSKLTKNACGMQGTLGELVKISGKCPKGKPKFPQ